MLNYVGSSRYCEGRFQVDVEEIDDICDMYAIAMQRGDNQRKQIADEHEHQETRHFRNIHLILESAPV